MKYLSEMTDEQTLVMYSGHPLGLFPSHKNAPRVVVTNGMVIPNYSKPDDWERNNALGVSQYGQMTAGSYMYIGPQGIVHGTTITVLNAARKHSSINFFARCALALPPTFAYNAKQYLYKTHFLFATPRQTSNSKGDSLSGRPNNSGGETGLQAGSGAR